MRTDFSRAEIRLIGRFFLVVAIVWCALAVTLTGVLVAVVGGVRWSGGITESASQIVVVVFLVFVGFFFLLAKFSPWFAAEALGGAEGATWERRLRKLGPPAFIVFWWCKLRSYGADT